MSIDEVDGIIYALDDDFVNSTLSAAGSPVSIDEADVGLCPIAMPLIAGAHVVSVRGKQGGEWRRDIKIARGQTVELRAPASRR